MAIPAKLQQHYDGRKTVEESLGTKDPAQARLKRDVFLIQQRAEFEGLRKVATAANAQKADSQLAAWTRHRRRVLETQYDSQPHVDQGHSLSVIAARQRCGECVMTLQRRSSGCAERGGQGRSNHWLRNPAVRLTRSTILSPIL